MVGPSPCQPPVRGDGPSLIEETSAGPWVNNLRPPGPEGASFRNDSQRYVYRVSIRVYSLLSGGFWRSPIQTHSPVTSFSSPQGFCHPMIAGTVRYASHSFGSGVGLSSRMALGMVLA
eukprot:317828-Hanusia_phi.AAC.1